MKKIVLVFWLSCMGCLTAMEKTEPYNGLIFLTIDNKTNKDWKIVLLAHGLDSEIEKHSKRSFFMKCQCKQGNLV